VLRAEGEEGMFGARFKLHCQFNTGVTCMFAQMSKHFLLPAIAITRIIDGVTSA
jgi:hypothetical protein